MTGSKVGPKGQVVIPKRFREQLGIEPGERVQVELGEDAVTIRKSASIEKLRGLLGPADEGMEDLEREHREELEREARRHR